jgi:TetR/AcrR family transcriptional regulator, transcriptional repressor for nem operon
MSRRKSPAPSRNPAATRERLVQATVELILKQGFTATSVDEICTAAGLTKGSFFHHFPNKEAIGLAAAAWWGEMGTALYAAAWEDEALDPLDQLNRFFDIMTGFTQRPDQACVCVVGMLSQEMTGCNPGFQAACSGHLGDWTRNTAKMLAAAKAKYPPVRDFDPEAAAWFLNSLWQGSMLVAKTRQDQALIRQNLQFARDWVDQLFGKTTNPPAPA